MTTSNNYYLEITAAEFNRQIGEDKKSSTVIFQNVDYKKGPTYSLSMRTEALTYCQNNMAKKLKSIIVESAHFITVWSQTKNSQNPAKSVASSSSINNTHQAQAAQAKIPTKKITRRYRGQTYEVEIPDYEALKKNQSQKQTQRKKYRGQYIN